MNLLYMILFYKLIILKAEDIPEKSFKCFNHKLVEIDFEYDRILTDNNIFVDVCDIGLTVMSVNQKYRYLTRNWRSPSYCKKIKKDWDALKKENRSVCIASYLSSPEKKTINGKKILESSGFWEVIKSEKWCHTYFEGNCKGIANATESF